MLKEKEMFDRAYAFLEKHYNDQNFDNIIPEYQNMQKEYKGSNLWQTLLLDVLDHLERKMKYERSKDNAC